MGRQEFFFFFLDFGFWARKKGRYLFSADSDRGAVPLAMLRVSVCYVRRLHASRGM